MVSPASITPSSRIATSNVLLPWPAAKESVPEADGRKFLFELQDGLEEVAEFVYPFEQGGGLED
jgi:hypothetical protein